MTEAEWLSSADPTPMLDFLRGKASERKLRLFACACVRRYWSHLSAEGSRSAVEVAEREADGFCDDGALRLAEHDAKVAVPSLSPGFHPYEQAAAAGARGAVHIEAFEAARLACGWGRNVRLALAYEQKPHDMRSTRNEAFAAWDAEAVALLFDIFGNPFRPVAFDPSWGTPSVVKVAHEIYENRAFDRLPDLSEALEEAGCHNTDLLAHCRGPGPHVRGCWVLDLVLEKE